MGDQRGLARIHSGFAWVSAFAGQTEDARQHAQTALNISEQIGYNLGKAEALSALAVIQPDIAQSILLNKQAYQARQASGYLGNGITNNLGVSYSLLGLYSRALRFYQKSLDIDPKATIPFSNIIHIEIEQDDLEYARQHIKELRAMERFEFIEAFTEELAGRVALLDGKTKEAIRHLKKAIRLSRNTRKIYEIGIHALLGDAHLENGEPVTALKSTSRAVKKHRELNFPKDNDHPSQNIWWRHSLSLRANKKNKEADEVLEMAYDFLLKGIESLSDVGLRRNYLNKVRINREIVQAWDKHAAKRKLPKERRFAHLEVESSLREPFERLAEISLELNALHSLEEIKTFLVEEATELSGGERVLLMLEKDGEMELADSHVPVGEDAQKTLASINRYLSPVRRTRTVKLTRPKRKGLSRIVAPLIAQNQVIGYLYTDMDSLYGRFDDTDRDMLGMLANQGAVALDNAGLLEGLEQKVEERTEELNSRVNELAIINSVQTALASKLDFQGIVDSVGDKLAEIFSVENVGIGFLDKTSGIMKVPYLFENGKRIENLEFPISEWGFVATVVKTRQPLMVNSNIEQNPKRPNPKSWLGVPIIIKDEVVGGFTIQNWERENAFNDSDVRLLQTFAGSLGVALENARLFEAEQERNAELAIINSVQEGLAKQLDFQGIIDLIGEKVGEIFKADTTAVGMYDAKRDWLFNVYYVDRGERIPELEGPVPRPSLTAIGVDTCKPMLLRTQEEMIKLGAVQTPSPGEKMDMNESFLGVPILAGKKLIGLISVQSYQQNAYDQDDLRLMQTLANSMSVALQNAQSFKAEQQRKDELAILNSVGEAMVKTLDVKTVTRIVGDKVRDIFDADVSIKLLDLQTQLIHTAYEYDRGEGGYVDWFPPFPLGKGLTSIIIQTRQPLLLGTLKEQKEHGGYLSPEMETYGSGVIAPSWLGAPIIAGDEVLGSVNLSVYREHAFGENDLHLLETLASNMGVAIQNARLFEAEQERKDELAILNSVGEAMAKTLDVKTVTKIVGDKIRDIFEAQATMIVLYDEKNRVLDPEYLHSTEDHYLNISERIPLGKGLTSKVITSKKPLLIASREERAAKGGYIPKEIEGTQAAIFDTESWLGVPILAQGKALGVVVIMDYAKNAFTESDQSLLETLASNMGVAIQNARLFEAEQERNAELAIINSVQEGLAKQLDFQKIIELVGEKVGKIFKADTAAIAMYDPKRDWLTDRYYVDRGERIPF
ncbi:MAG TPA: GAF domain-containing protein, partial [Anaerolineales bacterium]|nr:GAF domain-containing protein [Anaerolineales bacterium]